MAGLVLKLGPRERVLVNGVVMENGDRKTTLRIKTPDAAILRLRDALHPEDVKTPVTRACYQAQLCVAGAVDKDEVAQTLAQDIAALADAFATTPQAGLLKEAAVQLDSRNFYAVMRTLQKLIEPEAALLKMGRGLPLEEGPHAAPLPTPGLDRTMTRAERPLGRTGPHAECDGGVRAPARAPARAPKRVVAPAVETEEA